MEVIGGKAGGALIYSRKSSRMLKQERHSRIGRDQRFKKET